MATAQQRLSEAHRAHFIGRDTERAVFASALRDVQRRVAVLHIHGPGGVGKSTLLREFADMARSPGRTVLGLDARSIRATSPDLLRALADEIDATAFDERRPRHPEGRVQLAQLRVPESSVLLIDTCELLAPLDAWLRDRLLPALPDDVLVVLAGRGPPALAWSIDPAWRPLVRVIELGNFSAPESGAFFDSRAVPVAARRKVLEFTQGHPLALALVCDALARQQATPEFAPESAPDVIRHLLGTFLEGIPDDVHRTALDLCVIARVTDEALLVELLGAEAGRRTFRWLRGQSFIESGPHGIFPHDLAREVLLADARWRDAEAVTALSRRTGRTLHRRIRPARPEERGRLLMDALYVTRIRPTHAGFFDWSAMDGVYVDAARDEDADWIFALVARHEGAESAELAQHWWRVQRAAFSVLRGADDAPFGFLALLDLVPVARHAHGDPATAAALRFMQRHAPVRRDEKALYLRWWMHEASYQAVTAAINLTAMYVVSLCMTQPGTAWNFVAMADPGFWAPHFAGVNFGRAGDADFEIGGRSYGVFAHEWRIEPPAEWILGARVPMPFACAGAHAIATVVPSEALRKAVRLALRDFTRPDALGAGSLAGLLGDVESPDATGAGVGAAPVAHTRRVSERGAALRRLLREATNVLKDNPKDVRLHRALWYTYIEPLATQEQVAERLGVPFSTYRHHLKGAIERVAEWIAVRRPPP